MLHLKNKNQLKSSPALLYFRSSEVDSRYSCESLSFKLIQMCDVTGATSLATRFYTRDSGFLLEKMKKKMQLRNNLSVLKLASSLLKQACGPQQCLETTTCTDKASQ